jgi:hypothetical protein
MKEKIKTLSRKMTDSEVSAAVIGFFYGIGFCVAISAVVYIILFINNVLS